MSNETKTVPIEPTEEMLIAARDWSYQKYGKPVGNDGATGCYKAMLEAAPAPDDELARLERKVATDCSIVLLKSNSVKDDEGWYHLDGPVGTSHPHMNDEPEIRYLKLRGLLERHPDDPNLDRLREKE